MKDIVLACEENDIPPVGIPVEDLLEIMEKSGLTFKRDVNLPKK